jgi:hypothetical protein
LETFDSGDMDQCIVGYSVPADPKLSEARVTCDLGQPLREEAVS